MTKFNTSEPSVADIARRTSEIREANICRLCFKTKYLVSIDSDQRFIDQLADCLHQKISTSDFKNLPQFVCGECFHMVEALSQFKVLCSRASKTMKRYIRKGGKFPEHDMLEDNRPRRVGKRAASSRKESDLPASKRRYTEKTSVQDDNCKDLSEDMVEPEVDQIEILDTEQEDINEYNPKQLVAKFDELFGSGDMDLPGLKLILAATPPVSPVEQGAECDCISADVNRMEEDNVLISVATAAALVPTLIQNPWIDALDDEVLHSFMLNQLLESLKTDLPCRSYTSFVEDYVELQ